MEWTRERAVRAPYHPTGSISTRCLCIEQANPRIKAVASYSQTKLETDIPTTLVPRLNKGYTCRITKSEPLHLPYPYFHAPRLGRNQWRNNLEYSTENFYILLRWIIGAMPHSPSVFTVKNHCNQWTNSIKHEFHTSPWNWLTEP